MHSKKSQHLPVRTIIIVIVAVVAMAGGFFIYTSLSAKGSAASQSQVSAISGEVPNNYEMIFRSKAYLQSCYSYDKTPVALEAGANNICWTPPGIYGVDSNGEYHQSYSSPSYVCPGGHAVDKVVFHPELQHSGDKARITGLLATGAHAYTYAVQGQNTTNKNIELSFFDKEANSVWFILSADAETHYLADFDGLRVKSIECKLLPVDLVPVLEPDKGLIDLGESVNIIYGYKNLGDREAGCADAYAGLKITNLITGTIFDTPGFDAQAKCGVEENRTFTFTPQSGGIYRLELTVDKFKFIDEFSENNNIMDRRFIIVRKDSYTIQLDADYAYANVNSAGSHFKQARKDNKRYGWDREDNCWPEGHGGQIGKYILKPAGNSYSLGSGVTSNKIYGYVADGHEYSADEFNDFGGFAQFSKPAKDMPNNNDQYYFKYASYHYIELRSDDDFICGWIKDTDQQRGANNDGKTYLDIDIIE